MDGKALPMKGDTLLWIAGAAAVLYFVSQQTGGLVTAATPYSIYPSLARTQQTSMAVSPTQRASTVMAPSGLYSATQAAEQNAMYAQCAGAYPACSAMVGDTQLGL